MKKTVNINLAGYGFTIDEDAYAMLKDYLDALETMFRTNNYDDDLIDDLELRAAELLQEMAPDGAIVTSRDVEDVIARLGRPEEMVEETETIVSDSNPSDSPESTETVTPPPYNPAPKHRLYRDIDNKMLGGVCAGIAAYLNVDVVWIRLAFVLVTLASFSVAAVAYIILWIIVPAAETPLQKMELRGEAPTIDNIGRQVTNPDASKPRNAMTASTIWKVFLIGLAVICMPVLLGCGISFIVCLILLLMVLTSGGLWLIEGFGLTGGWESYPALGLALCLCVLMIVIIPLLAFLLTIFSSYNKPLNISRGWRITAAVLWVVSLIGLGITSGKFYHDTELESPKIKHITEQISEKISDVDINIDEETDSAGNSKSVRINIIKPDKDSVKTSE